MYDRQLGLGKNCYTIQKERKPVTGCIKCLLEVRAQLFRVPFEYNVLQ